MSTRKLLFSAVVAVLVATGSAFAAAPDSLPCQGSDVDRDGVQTGPTMACDCNDDDPLVRPGQAEPLAGNGIDDNCNAVMDEYANTHLDWPLRGRTVTLNNTLGLDSQPRIIWAHKQFGVVWHDHHAMTWFGQLSPPGDFSAYGFVADGKNPDVAWSGRRFAVVYETAPAVGKPEVRLQLLYGVGNVIADKPVALDAVKPRITYGVDRFGIVWQRPSCCSGYEIWFQRFSLNGDPMGTPKMVGGGYDPAIAFTGFTWERDQGFFDTPGWFGVSFYQTTSYPDHPAGVYLHRFAHNVVTPDPQRDLRLIDAFDLPCLGTDDCGRTALAASSLGFEVSYHKQIWGKDWVFGRNVTPDFWIDPQVSPGLTGSEASVSSAVAWTGSEFGLVVDNHLSGLGFDMSFRRLDATGMRHDTGQPGPWRIVPVTVGGKNARSPSLAWTGAYYGVVWNEGGTGLGFATVIHQ